MKLNLIDDCKKWWKLWSVRLNALGLALLAWVQIDPVSTLSVWNMMPQEAKAILPSHFIAYTGTILTGLAILARLVKQPKLGASDGQ